MSKTGKIRAKFEGVAKALGSQFAEREEVIEGLICAALAGEHVLLLGPPGTAKSALASQFCNAVDGAQFFEWLLSKFSAPEELFGPISLQGLKQDKYRRVTTGKLPEAHVAFLDEIFKANSAILNSLLTAINERKFHNNGSAAQIPLRMVVGASNELPEGPELEALYDRFLVRYWVEYVRSPDSFVALIQAAEPVISESLTLGEWDEAREAIKAVPFGEPEARAMFRLRAELAKHNLQVSDRRWKRCVRLVQAVAWFRGESLVDVEHFEVLKAALWHDPDERVVVTTEVEKVAAGVASKGTKIARLILDVFAKIPPQPSQPDQAWQDKLIGANREGNQALAKLRELQIEAKHPHQKARIGEMIKQVDDAMSPIRTMARESLGLG